MNRIIKFRTWDKESKCFLGPQEYIGDSQILVMTNFLSTLYRIDRHINFESIEQFEKYNRETYVVQQFTGLFDKNNYELYEGDIVKTDLDHGLSLLGLLPNYSSGTIEYINGGFCVCQPILGRTHLEEFLSCDCHPCGLEIIGNIFENSSFLNA